MTRRVSQEHVIWAYDHILKRYRDERLTAEQMRLRLREEFDLHVGVSAIKDVLRTLPRASDE